MSIYSVPPKPMNASAGGFACKSVAPSPIIITQLYPCSSLSFWITKGFPPSRDVGSVGSNPIKF